MDISQALKNRGQSYPFSETVSLPEMTVQGDPVAFTDVCLDGECTGTGESVSFTGKVRCKVRTRCARCLSPVCFPMEAPLDALFTRAENAGDPDAYPIDGFAADLADPAKDALLLELPMRILCRKNCKGLCPSCGVNLNEKNCSCQEGGKRENPFSALSELLTEDEEV